MFGLQGNAIMLPSDVSRGRAPKGGRIFFVHDLGDDDHEGSDPEFPLASITAALLKCTAAKGDYIFVQHSADTYYPAVNLNKSSVHLIGLGNGSYGPSVFIAGGNDDPAITIGGDSAGVEIAGFNLGSGVAQTDPALILSADAWYAHIHHNGFGTAIRALDGILIPAGLSFAFGSIDHNWFSRRLSGWGINCSGGGSSMTSSAILHNLLKMADGLGGVYIQGGEPEGVSFNIFGIKKGGMIGWAIKLGATVVDCMVIGNSACETGDNATGNNPYRDEGPAGVGNKLNFWSANYRGEAAETPAD